MCSLRTDLPPVMNVLCVLRGDAQNPTLSPRTQSAPRYINMIIITDIVAFRCVTNMNARQVF